MQLRFERAKAQKLAHNVSRPLKELSFHLVGLAVAASQHSPICVELTACPIESETVLHDIAHKPVIAACCADCCKGSKETLASPDS